MAGEQGNGASEGVGTRAYLMQMVRRYYGNLIDAWHYSGQPERAWECAEQAVRQGVWEQPMQRAREHIPGLAAQPVHDPSQFWFISYLEENYARIRAEVEQVLDQPLDPVRPTVEDRALIRKGSWKQAHLFRDGRWRDEVCARFPVTASILEQVPEVTTLSPGVITMSRVSPGTHIMPHCGPTNAVLRIHLPLIIPAGLTLRVAGQDLRWVEGKCLIFDDSFEHEVRHDGTEDRVVLILDMLHPDLGGDQRERLLQRRLTFEEQMVDFLKEHGMDRMETRDDGVVFRPNPTVRDELAYYMAVTGVTGAELRGNEVVWHRSEERPA
ncbi:aspartyl/asparaginyl beta-hydroxylase domain-containing protein [Streptoalloteichus hindustanus]|uniref:Aspartate beta-hydroxylase n=1 Tax=Streptoalloteichus hindustanus TaxID=2017 RepID=A4KUD1_STRHI|nr:aspartyl/asparaginyl beta-hydroxylase domain-containing protein [Streptoalloteichus hindustanus]ABL74959.1 TlmH [Streptoalloteichus hindustanus]SHF86386.1 aspartate beta-hydroxylase [Streptoalloteichus hindustanus]